MDDLKQLTRRAEQTEATAIADIMLSVPPAESARLELVLHMDSGVVASLIPTVDSLTLNRVVGLGTCMPATEAQLDRILDLARASGVKRLFLQVPPTAEPDSLTGWLNTRNARPYNRWVRLWHHVDTPLRETPGTDLSVTEISPEDADVFARVVREAYGFPPAVEGWAAAPVGRPGWKHYGAWDGDTLVATGAMFTTRHMAWIAFAATRSGYRGRGAQSSLIAERFRQASELGCNWVITETAEDLPDRPSPSYRNLRRLGFTEAYHRQNYVVDLAVTPDIR
jgi:GNAT superfamily N-acetyltransferase